MGEMTWIEYSKRIALPDTFVIVPVGAIEQHGPHLPLNTDALLPAEIALEVARRANGIVVPTITYGYKSIQRSGGGNHFCGTTSLDGNTAICVVRDILRELARHGARRVLILNGHFENVSFLLEGTDLAIRELAGAHINNFRVMTLTYWDFIVGDALAEVFRDGFPGWAVEHAGVMETSLMLHLFPKLVNLSLAPAESLNQFPLYDILPPEPNGTPSSGCLHSPVGASTDKGKLIFECVVSGIVAAVTERLKQKQVGR
jgi:creatinine amidohydrolase